MYPGKQWYITDVPHFVVDQNIHTIPTGIHCQQLWNVIIIAVIVLYLFGFAVYFWI